MRLIIDTNIIFSALYNMNSNAGRLLFLAIDEQVSLFAPEHVKRELKEILFRKLHFSQDEIQSVCAALPVDWVEDYVFAHTVKDTSLMIADPKDVPILACALALGMDIVSGDRHFHAVKDERVKVWKLRDAVECHRDKND